MNNLLFSVIIPTKQRHDTLKYAIRSVLNQSYPNFEIIISDNYSSHETYEVVHSFDDSRIRYFRTSSPLSMEDNWEFGLSKTTGEYIFVLGDDDALMPDGLELGAKLINNYNLEVVSWARHFYAWDSSIVPWLRNHLGISLPQLAEIRNSRNSLQKFFGYYLHYEELPMAYNSLVSRKLISEISAYNNRYFSTHCPDCFSGIVNAYFSNSYIYSYRPISITGTSGHSNGANHLFPSLSNDEQQKKSDLDLIQEYHAFIQTDDMDYVPVTPETAVADVQLKAKDLFFRAEEEIKFNILGYINTLISSINRDISIYNKMRSYITNLANKHSIDLSNVKIPDKEAFQGQRVQGLFNDNQGIPFHLRVNCEQAGIFNVADAAKLAQSILPDYSKLQVIEANDLNPNKSDTDSKILSPTILIDAIFFQFYETGIARVWRSLLEEWSKTRLSQHILVLDRGGTAPKIPNIRYRNIPAYNYDDATLDRAMLQQVCDEEGAEVFISSYYTIPETTPSVFMAYDMIPELLGYNMQNPMWQAKHQAIQHASSYISISKNTASDLVNLFPDISEKSMNIAHCGVDTKFGDSTSSEVFQFKRAYGLDKPYFLMVGPGFSQETSYKNSILFMKAFAQLENHQSFDIVCTGAISFDLKLGEYIKDTTIHLLTLDDRELKLAYAGATALIFPSRYEGFGIPILEAMSSGCPVITCHNSSIPEVAGDAAFYVDELEVSQMVNALSQIQKPEIREKYIHAGFHQAQKFTWASMAKKVSQALLEATLIPFKLAEHNYVICPDWSQPDDALTEQFEQVLTWGAMRSMREQSTLLIYLDDVDPEVANLVVSSAAMNLMMSSDLDISEGPEVSLVSSLIDLQWQVLVLKLQGRLQLEHENETLICQYLSNLPILEL
jgi:glycosyltransferase involved in cell wall biosynthesis